MEADRDSLSNEDFMQLETRTDFEDEEEPAEVTSFNSSSLSKALSSIEYGLQILYENDPDKDRYSKVAQNVTSAIRCYNEILCDIKSKAKQQTIEKF